MKILVASDIHGSFTSLEKLIGIFNEENYSYSILCGDYLNHGPRNEIPSGYDTKKTCELLNQYKEKIISVRGNCDSEVDQMILEFPVTSSSTQIFIPAKERELSFQNNSNDKPSGRIFIHHGHLFDKEKIKSLLPKGTLVVSGHTHIPVLEYDEGYFFLNPGSISIPKTDEGPTYATIESNNYGINRITVFNLETRLEVKCMEWCDLYYDDLQTVYQTYLRLSFSKQAKWRIICEAITVDKDSYILLTKRSATKSPYPSMWEFTGGSCISGENSIEGTLRELHEETGISSTEKNLTLIRNVKETTAAFYLYLNKMEKSKDEIIIKLEPGETDEYKWVTRTEFESIYISDEFCTATKNRHPLEKLLEKM